ncbi:hypothetical protein [Xanthomonas translucens]|uniref:hypothetical protein n=1 Tax=Xanthomonas campestris pv. translucens TaxID=343 RepID=UPI001F190FFE|nr:hypothetical protein [Xanthomonas translucens]
MLMDANVFALVPTHHYAGIQGNCLVIPRGHYENVLTCRTTWVANSYAPRGA